MAVRVLEAELALAEIHLARDARIHHPLQRAIDRGAADALIFATDQVDQIVGAQMAFLAEEGVDDQIALVRSACRPRDGAVRDLAEWRSSQSAQAPAGRHPACQTLNDEPHPQVDTALGFLMVKPPPVTVSTKSTSAPCR